MLWASSYHPAGGRSEASQAQGGHPPPTSPPRALCVQTSSAHSSLASLEEEWALAARPARAPWGTGGTPQAVPKERDLQESEEK